MKTRTINIILNVSIALALAYSALLLASPFLNDLRSGPAVTERIEEDDPRWNCKTMGNKVCGPTAEELAR
jgi:hypothetical protein